MKKIILPTGMVLVLLAGVLLAACQPTPTPPPPTPSIQATKPAAPAATPTATTATTAAPASTATPQSPAAPPALKVTRLDPATVDEPDTQKVCAYIYEGLTRLENGKPAPALALSWIVSADGLDYIFYLRPGVVFQDGTPLDADAVLANFNRWFDPQDPLHGTATYAGWQKIFLGFKGETDTDGRPKSSFDGIEKVNALTVLLHLNRADEALLSNLSLPYFGIASPTALAAAGASYGTAADKTSGTGAYTVSAWTASQLTLKPNAKYWGTPASQDMLLPLQ